MGTFVMMTCKEVSTLVSTGGFADASWFRRVGAWLHLSMCRHCRAFRRQVEALTRVARAASQIVESEPAPDFESRIAVRLRK
jgi:predicted anti-sigma-YlaC factor YlaD